MRDPRELRAADIADDLVKLHNLPPSDRGAHEALLQEVNSYFQYNINELRKQQALAHAQHREYDLRGNVIALFKNVEVQTSFDQREGPKAPYHMDFLDFNNNRIELNAVMDASSRERPQIPTCFQYSDQQSRLSFTINTDGNLNADFLYQQMVNRKLAFPPQYKTWSQYWGGQPTAPAYNPGQSKGKYEL